MDYPFEHPDFQGRSLAVRTSGFFGAARLVVDGAEIVGTKGKFPLHDNQGNPRELKLKANFLDPIPKVDLDGTTIDLARSLTWYEYTWMGLPIVLVVAGGALGALFGILATYSSARIFRGDRAAGAKYAISGLISLGAVAGFFASAAAIQLVIAWNTDIATKEALDKIARASNKELPRMIDEQTELVKLEGLEGVLVYHYRLPEVHLGQISGETFVRRLGPVVSANTCGNSESRERFLENGVTLRHVYSDSQSVKIGEFDVTLSDCP
jgi:hypothetical protein